MKDKVAGYLEVGVNTQGEVILNLDKDRNGIGHIIFSPNQARAFAEVLISNAASAEKMLQPFMKSPKVL